MSTELRRITAILALLCVAGCGLPEAEIVDVQRASVHEAEPARERLGEVTRVISWNLKGSRSRNNPEHLQNVARVVRTIGPDLVLLQEIHRNTLASGGIDQFVLLSESLDMNGCFGESLEVGNGSYGNAILTTGEIRDARVHVLPGSGEPRTILECTSRWGELDVPVLTTHLTAWDRANRRTRSLQTTVLEALIGEIDSPLILIGGDFNASLSAAEMRALRSHEQIRPAISEYAVTHPGTGRHYDHILVGDGWTIEDAQVTRQGPSDHWPVIAELRIGKAK